MTIDAKVTKYGFEEGNASVQLVIEPAPKYEDTSTDDLGAYLLKYSPFIIAVVILIIVNLLIFVLIKRRRNANQDDDQKKGGG